MPRRLECVYPGDPGRFVADLLSGMLDRAVNELKTIIYAHTAMVVCYETNKIWTHMAAARLLLAAASFTGLFIF